nr:PREDICTED: solute carrier organic anion transporter family member 4A1-like [Latimeria chalumnae]|eukprot:XP_014353298.1 PREDICTED: solute carrier organic anion transporter family member 4A1-like [Latimeria chalumnae]
MTLFSLSFSLFFIYIPAIFYTAAIIGPAAGYLLGGMFLNIYTEIGTVTDLTPENPLWVGAWWIGFLVGGAAAFLVSIPILAYPVQLPGSQRYVVMRVSEAHQLKDGSQKTASDPDFGKTLKDLPRSSVTSPYCTDKSGYCTSMTEKKKWLLSLFLPFSPPPSRSVSFRCVPDSQRSFGLGIQWIVVRTLGGIPGPIAFGSVIDISCLLWQDQCGDQGSCYLYQNSAMSWYTLIAGLVYKALGLMFFFSAWLLYKPPPPSPTSSSENVDKEDSNPPEKDLPAEI